MKSQVDLDRLGGLDESFRRLNVKGPVRLNAKLGISVANVAY
jgi:hypothetical protein